MIRILEKITFKFSREKSAHFLSIFPSRYLKDICCEKIFKPSAAFLRENLKVIFSRTLSFFFFLFLPTFCLALQQKPWFGDLSEFYLKPFYEYQFFDEVDNAKSQLPGKFQTHLLGFSFDLTAPDTWNYEIELECADTTSVSWGYRSFALQVRKLWLDDVCGDLISLTTGLSIRDASNRMRRALSTPYHSRVNFELQTVFGKEWSRSCFWMFRTYGVIAVGQGTSGSPWLKGDLYLGYNHCDIHQFELYGKSYWGFGSLSSVSTSHFKGWQNTRHQSIDLGASYACTFDCYGKLRLDYQHRVYALSYPEHANIFTLSYELPFSIF